MEQLLGGFWGKLITFTSSELSRQAGGRGFEALLALGYKRCIFLLGVQISLPFSFPLNNPSRSHPSFASSQRRLYHLACWRKTAKITLLSTARRHSAQCHCGVQAQGHKLYRTHSEQTGDKRCHPQEQSYFDKSSRHRSTTEQPCNC